MKLSLKSDWRDYYDHMFHMFGDDLVVFERLSRSGPNKEQQFDFLVSLGQNTPSYGKISDLLDETKDDTQKFVIYDDLDAHAGDGKRLVDYQQALKEPVDSFASSYIPRQQENPITLRWLQVGYQPFLLEYSSDDDWRSNCGDVNIKILQVSDLIGPIRKVPYPLWAIDYIPLNNGEVVAIDFNISPGLRGTGVEEHMTASEVVHAITYVMEILLKK
jgi:hypothetical protein